MITNNKNIVKYPFYNKNNIFIIGNDNIQELNDFLNTDFQENNDDILYKYSYNNWIEHLVQQ